MGTHVHTHRRMHMFTCCWPSNTHSSLWYKEHVTKDTATPATLPSHTSYVQIHLWSRNTSLYRTAGWVLRASSIERGSTVFPFHLKSHSNPSPASTVAAWHSHMRLPNADALPLPAQPTAMDATLITSNVSSEGTLPSPLSPCTIRCQWFLLVVPITLGG